MHTNRIWIQFHATFYSLDSSITKHYKGNEFEVLERMAADSEGYIRIRTSKGLIKPEFLRHLMVGLKAVYCNDDLQRLKEEVLELCQD